MTIATEAPADPAAGHHGTPRGYRLRCRQDCCRVPYISYRKRMQLFGSLTTDPAPVAAHINRLLDAGASRQSIADAAGTSRTKIQQILKGSVAGIRTDTRDRIMAVTSAALMGYVGTAGPMRKVRALVAVGRTLGEVVTASGAEHNLVSKLVNGHRASVRAATAAAIDSAYRQIGAGPGTSAASRARAVRNGWAPPAAWDGIDIDDPATFPDWTGACGTPRGRRLHHESGIPVCPACAGAGRTKT